MICVLNYCIVFTISSSTKSSSSYSVVSCWVFSGSFQANFMKWNLKLLKIFWSSFSRPLPLYDSFDKMIAWSFLIIYSTIYFIYFQQKKNDFEFPITYRLKFQETLIICLFRGLFVWNSGSRLKCKCQQMEDFDQK